MSEPHPTTDPEVLIPRLEKLLQRLMRRRRVRHAIVGAASLDGSWSWSDAEGQAGPAGGTMRVDTPWFLASVTKLYIAAVVLRLCEQGVVGLRTPITECLPPTLARGLHVLDGVDRSSEMTLVHLLGHFSGLPDYLDERPDGGQSLLEEVVDDGDRGWTLEEAVARARDLLAPHFPPSDPYSSKPKIRYSDTNYQLLMAVAEHVTGQPMGQLYRQLIFGPLQLRHTWLPGGEPAEPAGEPATVWLGDVALVDRPLAMQSFGDLYSTMEDVMGFGRSLFSGALFEDPATAEQMWQQPHRFGFPRGLASLRAPSWPIEYGLGAMRFGLSRWLSGGLRIPAVIGHTGSTGSWLWYAPALRLLLAGTVDQTAAATVPFRVVPRALAGLTE